MEHLECPTCGPVMVLADVWEGAKAISGICPNCAERLHFDDPEREQKRFAIYSRDIQQEADIIEQQVLDAVESSFVPLGSDENGDEVGVMGQVVTMPDEPERETMEPIIREDQRQ